MQHQKQQQIQNINNARQKKLITCRSLASHSKPLYKQSKRARLYGGWYLISCYVLFFFVYLKCSRCYMFLPWRFYFGRQLGLAEASSHTAYMLHLFAVSSPTATIIPGMHFGRDWWTTASMCSHFICISDCTARERDQSGTHKCASKWRSAAERQQNAAQHIFCFCLFWEKPSHSLPASYHIIIARGRWKESRHGKIKIRRGIIIRL